MPLFDHLGITVENVSRGVAQFGPILEALGLERTDGDDLISWWRDGETEFVLMPPRAKRTGPHVHGTVGWQHLAFAVDSREEVDRLHQIALNAGWSVVRSP